MGPLPLWVGGDALRDNIIQTATHLIRAKIQYWDAPDATVSQQLDRLISFIFSWLFNFFDNLVDPPTYQTQKFV